MDLPGHGVVEGAWDLRETADAYIGHFDPTGKRVLEIGTASGFVSFHMERRGAREVVGYDLAPGHAWDVLNATGWSEGPEIDEAMGKLNDSYWLAHGSLGSSCKLAHGSIYGVPAELGVFDAVVLCSVLMHVRDPILAVQRLAARCDEIVITERMPAELRDSSGPVAMFMPDPSRRKWFGGWTWWLTRPEVYVNVLKLLGFGESRIETSEHYYKRVDRTFELYHVVARRTEGQASTAGLESSAHPAMPGSLETRVDSDA